jgi:hypothetical protein
MFYQTLFTVDGLSGLGFSLFVENKLCFYVEGPSYGKCQHSKNVNHVFSASQILTGEKTNSLKKKVIENLGSCFVKGYNLDKIYLHF